MRRIKLILFALFSIFLVGNINVTASVNPQESLVDVTIITYFDSDNQITTHIYSQPFGSRINISSSLSSLEGYTFAFWIVNDVIKYDLAIDNSFVLNGSQTITAVFKPVGEVVAAFMDSNGKLLDIQYLSVGGTAVDLDLLSLPNKPGYVISSNKWDHLLTNIQSDTIFTLQYTRSLASTYTVSVVNGTGGGTVEYNTQTTVVASPPLENMYFAYWKVGNDVVSTESTYTFTVFDNKTIEAVYSDTLNPSVPFITLSPELSIRDGYFTYLGQFELPSGFTLIEHGMITSDTSGIINLSTVGTTKYQSNSYYALTNEYLMSFANTSIQSVRAYMIVEDANGNFQTIYNEVLSESVASVTASDLFFSFYMEGSSNNKVLSIFNGTGNTVDLSLYQIKVYNNGASTPNSTFSFATGASIANGEVYVVVNSSATTLIKSYGTEISSGPTSFNGDDSITLVNNGTVIDSIGQIGYDPGTEWSVNGVSTLDKTLTRKTSITHGDTTTGDAYDPSLEWDVHAIDTIDGINTFTMDGGGTGKTVVGFDAFIYQTEYSIYNSLILTNSYLRVYYDDGSSSIETITSNMVSNYDATVAGIYQLTVTYGSLTDVLLYQINKILPDYDVPTLNDVEFFTGMTLSDITLPANFTWDNPSTEVTIGSHTYQVTYTPDNQNTYLTVDGIDVSINILEHVTPIIIYEVYGGGGNTSATYNQDYVILYNTTNAAISLSGYSIQYKGTSTYSVLSLSGTIQSHNYFVIGLASGSVGSSLPITPQVSGGLNIAQTSGHIALVSNTTAIASISDPDIIDFLGYGTAATEFETASTATLSSSLSAKRNSFVDTNDNSLDFTVGTPNLDYVVASLSISDFAIHNLKAYYELNEALSILNSYLVVSYSNGSSANVDITSDMISNFSTAALGSFSLTVTYEGIQKTYPYQVIDYSALDSVSVNYIDIGATGGPAGEASLIKIGGIEILIDSGDDDSSSQQALLDYLGTVVSDGVIEYMIATHPHADHIGGMIDVLSAYSVTNVIQYSTTNATPSTLQIDYETAVANENANVYYVYNMIQSAQNVIEIIPGVTITFYDDGYLQSTDPNNSSIIFVLDAFDTLVLFNGDAEGDQEQVYAPLVGDIDILKLGHHGSAVGTTTYLLTTTTPNTIVVNDGNYLGNSYGHPTYTALSRIYAYSKTLPVYSVTGGNGASSDRMLQRNGTISVNITSTGYLVSSEYYGYNPIELSNTDYWDTINTNHIAAFYYSTATGITDSVALKLAMHNIIKGHHSVGYDQVDENLGITDEDPNNSNNVILLYTGRSQAKSTFGAGVDDWNREHVWAKSHGFETTEPMYSDLHHLRPTDDSVNAIRGNLDFSSVIHNSSTLVDDVYGSGSTFSYVTSSYFDPRDEVKGDVARMLMYMTVRYEGDVTPEPDLELVNGITTVGSTNLGDLATLLQWNFDDPVDAFEMNRNNKIYGIQGNRNPFIDNNWLIMILYASQLEG